MSRHEYRRLGWCRGCGLLVATLVIMATYSMEPPVYEGTITLYSGRRSAHARDG